MASVLGCLSLCTPYPLSFVEYCNHALISRCKLYDAADDDDDDDDDDGEKEITAIMMVMMVV